MAVRNRNISPPQICDPQTQDGLAPDYSCDPFSVCLINRTLVFDGGCLSVQPSGNSIPDGSYTQFTLVDGCIVSAGQAPLPVYTPSACCGGSSGGGTSPGTVIVSPDARNLTTTTPAGIMTSVSVIGGTDMQVTGTGTPLDPIIVTALPQGHPGNIVGSTPPIVTQGTGEPSSPLIISMETAPLAPGVYGGFTLDQYGRVMGYSAVSAPAVSIFGTPPIAVNQPTPGVSVFTVSLTPPAMPVAGNYEFGPLIMSVGDFGTITAVAQGRPPVVPGQFYAPASPDGTIPAQIISFDADGFITAVVPG